MPALKDQLIEDNMGLVRMVVKKYRGFGIEEEDLLQIGSIGLLKAARDFEPHREIKFSTYAVAKIIGEIKTYLRDHSEIKISRKYKEDKIKIDRATRALTQTLGREPKLSEISSETGITIEEILAATEAMRPTLSLDLPPEEGGVIPKIPSCEEDALNRVMAREMLSTLPPLERSIMIMRYFKEETQSKIAENLGLTQVTVSRMEKRILKELRDRYK